MKKTIIIMLTVFSAVSVAQNKIVKTFYDLRQTIPKEVYYTNSYGVKNGSYKLYSEYGGVISEGNYKDDNMVGTWKFKDEKGISTDIETYDNSGNKNGPWIKNCIFNRNLKGTEGTYKNNKKDGLWIHYFCQSNTTESKLESEETYANDVLNGQCKYYHEDGTSENGIMLEGRKSGEWKYYDINGRLSKTEIHGTTKSGNYTIEFTKYYQNGSVSYKGKAVVGFYYNIDYMIGEELEYYEDGVLFSKNTWNSDSITQTKKDKLYLGTREEYYKDGKINVKSGSRFYNGKSYYYGKKVVYYSNGKIKNECEIDENGYEVPGTSVGYLESGELDEKSRAAKLEIEMAQKAKVEKQEREERERKYKSIQKDIVTKHNEFQSIYVVKKEMAFVVDEYGKPKTKDSFPMGKKLYEKSESLYQEFLRLFNSGNATNESIQAGTNALNLLNKMNGLSQDEAKKLEKEIKKAETLDDIKKVLGI